MQDIIEALDVEKWYGTGESRVHSLQAFSIQVKEAEFVTLLGASGCGKSTFLNLVAGFVPPTSGTIRLMGEEIRGINPRVGMMAQNYSLFPWKTVQGNIEFGPKMKGIGRRQRRDIARQFVDLVGLRGFEDFYPHQLSGGMQQRVSLARSLAADPAVFLMDEPFAALDAMTRQILQEELIQIHEQSSKTIIFVTHNIDEALILSDRIVVLSARPGRLKLSLANTLPRPRHVAVQLSPEYLDLKRQLWESVQEEARKQVA